MVTMLAVGCGSDDGGAACGGSAVEPVSSPGGRLEHVIVAFYGHAATDELGVLGEGTPEEARQRLADRLRAFESDSRRIIPAFELIATLATSSPGDDELYRSRTDERLIRPYLETIRPMDGQLILDLQPGRSDFETEARGYEPLLLEPDVGLALDPEWRVGPDETPVGGGGSVDAAEINRVSAYLALLVDRHALPPKLLIVHRFSEPMVTDADEIVDRPGVEILFQADGEGTPEAKACDYRAILPDRFARGMKVFLDEDVRPMEPAEVLALNPRPDYVSYQ